MSSSSPVEIPVSRGPFHGKFASLVELTRPDVDDFWDALDLPHGADDVYRYTLGTPATSKEQLWQRLSPKPGRVQFALKADPKLLHAPPSQTADIDESIIARRVMLGAISYSVYDASAASLDIGAVFAPALQRTAASTEGIYLLLCAAFEPYTGPRAPGAAAPPFHRIMWKCNALNAVSSASARRYGFTWEGTLRMARISKGIWVSSEWWSMLDEEWPTVRAGFEAWLESENFDDEGKQRRRLEECRTEAPKTLNA